MGDTTKIEWADATLNFWIGCTQLKRAGGSACDNCYAKQMAVRLKVKWNAPPVRSGPACFARVATYQRGAQRFFAKHGRPRRVFVNSMSDFFDNQAEQAWRDEACSWMEEAHDVIFMLLTKRPENVLKMVPKHWLYPRGWPKNVWLGVTVEAQDTADHRIPLLLAVPGVSVRFLSMEPLLEPVSIIDAMWAGDGDPADNLNATIDWVIIGGESGRNARPTNQKWIRAIIKTCEQNGVPVLFKQWGEWCPTNQLPSAVLSASWTSRLPRHEWGEPFHTSIKIGKTVAGRRLDGTDYTQFPVAL